jgi:thioredoxin reductase (NADPH)
VLPVTGVFVLIGVMPNNDMLPLDQLQTDESGFLLTDSETVCPGLSGVFAAGDIRSKLFRQIINAAGEGANAELAAEQYLSSRPTA